MRAVNEEGPFEGLPLLSDQVDRLTIQEWVEERGLGVEVRMIGRGFRLTGPLRTDALRSALTALVARHEALRVAVPQRGKAGRQEIRPARPFVPDEEDLRDLPGTERLDEALRRAGVYLGRNRDLDGGLLFSAVVYRLGDEDHLLGVAADHLVLDGQSFEILVNELWELYAAEVEGREAKLPEQPFTYSDFVRWEAEWLGRDPEPRQLIARFAELLDGIGTNAPVSLPKMRRETNDRYEVGTFDLSLPAETFQLLTEYCRSARTTPFIVLFSSYLCALHARNGRADLTALIPVTRRTQEHLLDLVCLLSTYATVRVQLDTSVSFRQLTRQVRSAVLETQRLGQVPAPEVTSALAPHMLGRLLESPCTFFDAAPGGWSGGSRRAAGLAVEPTEVPGRLQQIESLELFASVDDKSVDCSVLFPADVFGEEEVRELAHVFTSLVHRLLSSPDTAVAELLPSAD
ncbi:condensation domain-containing protein [Streptomyces maremycinicus]|uniref:condensation domain-containing protein n=1 Tax=Streptomyces maremycinicus TaxID=1679753 RepID=UPI0007868AB5|nr:condensation domain-containing protein [Streptomyces sp. NBRC 110468]